MEKLIYKDGNIGFGTPNFHDMKLEIKGSVGIMPLGFEPKFKLKVNSKII